MAFAEDDLVLNEVGKPEYRARDIAGTAQSLGPVSSDLTGLIGATTASLYRLSVPFEDHDYVVVSTIEHPDFLATSVDSCDADGSGCRVIARAGLNGIADHVRALENMGYRVVL